MTPDAPPRDNPHAPRWRRRVVFALLALHAIWIAVHLGLVARGVINPWKLGGYGMYTIPHPRPLTHVFLRDAETGDWREALPTTGPMSRAGPGGYETALFDLRSRLHVFKCRPVTSFALAGFMRQNPELKGENFALVVSEAAMERAPLRFARGPHHAIRVTWESERRAAFEGEVCGRAYAGGFDIAPER